MTVLLPRFADRMAPPNVFALFESEPSPTSSVRSPVNSLYSPCKSGSPRALQLRSQPDVSTRPDFRLFPLLCALFFPLLAIVPAPAAFLSPSQGLAL